MGYKYVPVSKEDTYELIKRAQNGDEEAKALLMEQNTGLVKKIALKFSAGEQDTDDLIQIGYIGLLKAVYKFEPTYGVMFSTYAVPMIMGELKRFFRDTGKIKVSRSLKAEIGQLKKAEQQLCLDLGRQPKLSELARAMETTAEHVTEIMETASAVSNVTSLDQQLVEEANFTYGVEHSPENNLDGIMLRKEIQELPQRERQVILLRYYKDMTQQEIAKVIGISQVQVSRTEKRALEMIRGKMAL